MSNKIKSNADIPNQSLDNKSRRIKKRGDLLIRIAIMLRKIIIKDKVSVTENYDEVIKAQKLLYKEYFKRNLCEANIKGEYINPYSFLKTTRMFISKRKEKIVGTISVVGDGSAGIPADTLYSKELDSFRAVSYTHLTLPTILLV